MDTTDTLRCWSYEALGRLFDPDPAPPGEPPDDGDAVLAAAAAALSGAWRTAPRPRLMNEQVRLFVNGAGGVPAPPYASWYLDGRLLGPASTTVAAAYARQGLVPAADTGEPADFAGTELEFMYFLCRHEAAARATADCDAIETITAARREFARHLGQWLPEFVARIRAATADETFVAAAALIEALLAVESQHFPMDSV